MDGRVGVPPGPPQDFPRRNFALFAKGTTDLGLFPTRQGRHTVPWTWADKLAALRGPGESYSDVILRLVELETGRRLGTLLAVCRQSVIGRSAPCM